MKKFLLVASLLPFGALAQQPVPQPMALSIEYYQQRIMETDARAAAMMHENVQLKARLEMLLKASEKPKEAPKKE